MNQTAENRPHLPGPAADPGRFNQRCTRMNAVPAPVVDQGLAGAPHLNADQTTTELNTPKETHLNQTAETRPRLPGPAAGPGGFNQRCTRVNAAPAPLSTKGSLVPRA